MVGSRPLLSPARVAALVNTSSSLLASALAPSTRYAYERTWTKFRQFAQSLNYSRPFPATTATVALFIASLVSPPSRVAPSSVASAISAIAYYHKIYSFEDPTSHFIIRKITQGLSKSHSSPDLRVPITLPMLTSLVASVPSIANTYDAILLPAMFLTMFFGFLRLGETTESTHNLNSHQLTCSDSSATITFASYKHSKGRPFSLQIPASPASPTCPVRALNHYLNIRGTTPGPLFRNMNGSPITPYRFRSLLRTAVSHAALSDYHITPHSFRIGAATYAATKGFTSTQIQAMGRWHSNAFRKYVRIASFASIP